MKTKRQIRDAARYQANKEAMKAAARIWYAGQREAVLARRAVYYAEGKDEILAYQAKYHSTVKGKATRRRANAKYLSTPKGRLCDRMGRGILRSIKLGAKAGAPWETLVNFDKDILMSHLATLFTEGMTFEGFQKGLVHIDHKIPVSAFNFETPNDVDFKWCWSLENLQPMWAKDNLKKSNKLDKPFQPSLLL